MKEEVHVGVPRPRALDGEGLDLLEPGDRFVELGFELPVTIQEREPQSGPAAEHEEVGIASGGESGIEDHLDAIGSAGSEGDLLRDSVRGAGTGGDDVRFLRRQLAAVMDLNPQRSRLGLESAVESSWLDPAPEKVAVRSLAPNFELLSAIVQKVRPGRGDVLERRLDPHGPQLLERVFTAAVAFEQLPLADESRAHRVAALEDRNRDSRASKMDRRRQSRGTGAGDGDGVQERSFSTQAFH